MTQNSLICLQLPQRTQVVNVRIFCSGAGCGGGEAPGCPGCCILCRGCCDRPGAAPTFGGRSGVGPAWVCGMHVRSQPLFRAGARADGFDAALAVRLEWRRRRALRAAYGRRWTQTIHAQREYDSLQGVAHRLAHHDVNWLCECRACRFTDAGGPSDRVADGLGARAGLFLAPNVGVPPADHVYRSQLRARARRIAQSRLRRAHLLGFLP